MFKSFSFLSISALFRMILVLFCVKTQATDFSLVNLEAYQASLTADFSMRDRLPETAHPRERSPGKFDWGPKPLTYPPVEIPKGVNPIQWERDRVIAIAKKYIGLPYMHRHIPMQGGLDCSNFTSWVYNYGFGIRFSSNTQKQAQEAGRRLAPNEELEPGDLLFIWNKQKNKISHVVLYVDPNTIIDSTITKKQNGVALRPFKGWYKERFAWARRIF